MTAPPPSSSVQPQRGSGPEEVGHGNAGAAPSVSTPSNSLSIGGSMVILELILPYTHRGEATSALELCRCRCRHERGREGWVEEHTRRAWTRTVHRTASPQEQGTGLLHGDEGGDVELAREETMSTTAATTTAASDWMGDGFKDSHLHFILGNRYVMYRLLHYLANRVCSGKSLSFYVFWLVVVNAACGSRDASAPYGPFHIILHFRSFSFLVHYSRD